MIFSSKPALIAMERMMTQPPYYRPRGHGKCKPKKLPPDKAHYKCEYCLHYDRKKKCKLIQCPYMDERIKARAVTLTEALIETMKGIHNTAFRKRFNKMLMKSEERKMFSPQGKRLAVSLYLSSDTSPHLKEQARQVASLLFLYPRL